MLVPGSRAGLSLAPGVVASGRHPQASAHHPDRVLPAAALYRAKSHFDSLAKNAAASRKKSRSRLT